MGDQRPPGLSRTARRRGAILVPALSGLLLVSAPLPLPPAGGLASAATAALTPSGPANWATHRESLAPAPRLRVGILPDVPEVTIGADAGVLVFRLGQDGAPEGPGHPLPRATFQPEGTPAGLRLIEAATMLPAALVVPAQPAGTLTADGLPYRGYLEVRAREGRLRVVNVVDVEDYRRGVVPNELSPGADSDLEAIKAVGTSPWDVFLPPEAHPSPSTVTGLNEDIDVIDELHSGCL